MNDEPTLLEDQQAGPVKKTNKKVVRLTVIVGVFIIVLAVFIYMAIRPGSNASQTLLGSVLPNNAATTKQAEALPQAPVNKQWKLAYADEFEGTSLNTTDWSVRTGTEGHSQSNYTKDSVKVSGGYLRLDTKRHCVDSATAALTGTNMSSQPCASGKITKYSSGFVDSVKKWRSGYIEVRAKLPPVQKGLWPAIWMRNTSGWCTQNYGELDIMEWYADQPNNNTATSHFSCANNSTKKSQHNLSVGSSLVSDWHVWSMQWGGDGVEYKIDGKAVPSSGGNADKNKDTNADLSGLSAANWKAVLDQDWRLKLNTQVIKAGVGAGPWHSEADNSKPFNPASYLIDYVRVYEVRDGSADTKAPTTTLMKPTNGQTVNGALTLEATASDESGISKVEFYVDSNKVAEAAGSPYKASYDTKQLKNGTHQLYAKAYDTAGNTGRSVGTTNIVVDNGTQTPTNPTPNNPTPAPAPSKDPQAIKMPDGSTNYPGEIAYYIEADNQVAKARVALSWRLVTNENNYNSNVQKVEYYLNGSLRITQTAAPFGLNTRNFPNGTYELKEVKYFKNSQPETRVFKGIAFDNEPLPSMAEVIKKNGKESMVNGSKVYWLDYYKPDKPEAATKHLTVTYGSISDPTNFFRDSKLKKIEYYLDGNRVQVREMAPFGLDVRNAKTGWHTYKEVLFFTNGKTQTRVKNKLFINN